MAKGAGDAESGIAGRGELSDAQYDWLHRFGGVDPRGAKAGKGPPRAGTVDAQGTVWMNPVDVPAPHRPAGTVDAQGTVWMNPVDVPAPHRRADHRPAGHRPAGHGPAAHRPAAGGPAGTVDEQGTVWMSPVDVPAPRRRTAPGHGDAPGPAAAPGAEAGPAAGAAGPGPGAPGAAVPRAASRFRHSFRLGQKKLRVWHRRLELKLQLSAQVSLAYEGSERSLTDLQAPLLQIVEQWVEGVLHDLTATGAVWDGAAFEHHGAQARLHAQADLPIGRLQGNLVLAGLRRGSGDGTVTAELQVMTADVSLTPHEIALPDQTVNGLRLSQIRVGLSGSAQLSPDWVQIVREEILHQAEREGAEAAEQGVRIVVAEVTVDALAAVAGACAVCFVFVEGLMQAWQLSRLLGDAAHINDQMLVGFLEAFAGRRSGSDPFEQTGHQYGEQVYQTALATLQRSHPGQTEEQYRQAMLGQAEAAYRQSSGRIAALARTAAWDGYLRANPHVLVWHDAQTAYRLLFGHDPSDDHPDAEWSKYLQHYPIQRYL